ncbi:putative disease resistance RPP13-like protein 1 isoform X1 [Ziziphus jujuba]|uniref:Disease resistance RPP13-like protein 1 isoform X1 n=1 Tax=Ziziphus jujuba TaxID=326968 RepID=A0ABM3ZYL2_ZIZJJ|nr:putative disease resistance RPP13-like protein 1 isoform X1 [Ziziphus jujuba]XP_060669567.1 putative disease resistance RPP13-like protein 1 isoform X1 [Ziziphus jujuba]XP_060669568.1 putative disease resistance RPP13-like protein 1 isoform X1 [Ziziphus jujuba]XP_060669569.1 putative disease resistance RPP13-like protein 1 isoform X1 [Ziziphus jujuba]
MAASLVGGAFLSATLQVVFDRLASQDVVDYLRGKKLNDELINNLKTVLSAVNAVLDDAEDKQITNPNVKQWLDELEDASYDADDLLDEITTDVLQSKLEAGSGTSNSSKSIINFFSSSLNIYDRKTKNKLEKILKRLKFLEERIYVLGLNTGVGEKPLPRPPTTSLIEEAEVFGRDGDKEATIKLLLTDGGGGNKIGVIPIKGMGGVGKTTLAQLVYNHDQVKEHFELKSWVCVSEEFDIYKVTKTILSAVANSESYDNADLDSLQIKLKELLAGKKFLIVLDDVWNENYVKWENMCKPFKNGAQGSKILVTTRNESVAQIMRTVPTQNLEHLKDEYCWKLFQKHVFPNENFTAHPTLEIIGRKIVKKCKGLPLAAKTLGGLLRSTVNVEKWERISESEIWDLSDNESNILPALRLSYHYLPSHLKGCFAFCSIFPKDYRFQKHELVLLWMAENFVQQSKRNKRMEDVGDEYFNELVSRSFFQRSSNEIESCFFMHDLIHDLAKYVSRNYCVTLADGNSEEALMVKVRHLAIRRSTPMARFDSIFEAAYLRTLLPTHTFSFDYISGEVVNHVILKLKCLRILSLSGCRKLKKLPESIGEQKHLRHLDLSGTSIESLPESVCMLYNLQTLKLSSCSNLIELPKDIHHLINLRLLDIRWCGKLEKMPRHVSKLKSLQTLSTFVVGRDNAAKIGELRELQDLHGRLSLLKLNNVSRAKDALEAKLMDKKYLEELDLAWKDDTNDSKHDREVLENLSPHTKLKRLSVYGYGGTTFPNWLGNHSFCNIVFIMLSNCKYCNCLPPLGQLPSLKTLYIEQLSGVVSVGAEFYGSSERKPFASLKFLSFSKMSNWEEWSSIEVEDGEVFPQLQELEIRECHRLMNVDWPRSLPRLTELRIFGKVLVPSLPSTPAIRKVELGECEKLQLQELPQTVEWFTIGGSHGIELFTDILRKSQTRHHLQHLGIHNCSSLVTFPSACLPTTLKELVLYFCEKLEFPMHHSLKTSSIQKVFIINSFGCSGSLKFFPLDFIPSLKDLVIKG